MSEDADYIEIKQKFDRYYETEILPSLQKIEIIRKKSLIKLVSVCVFVLAWIGWDASRKETFDFSVINCFVILLILWPTFGYYKKSKESILPLLAKFFGDFTYSFQKPLSDVSLTRSRIVSNYDKISTDDTFSGVYEGVPVSITEYILYNYTRDKDGYRYTKSGGGLVFYAAMNKKFTGQTIIVKDRGIFNRFTSFKNLERVGLESSEFEKAFEVYSDNQIEARYILTPVMLEYIMELKKDFPRIQFSFFEEHVFINIETEDLFECSSFFTSIINKERMEKNFKELYLLFSIIKTLKLNQKQMF